MSPEQLLLLPLWYVAFLLAVTCHEAAHATAAHLGGDDTAYLGGQVSLNPLPHMQREPVGTLLVPLLTFLLTGWMMGWASAPYDPSWEDRHPRRAALMALAGPLANLALAIVAFAILRVGLEREIWIAPMEIGYARLVASPAEDPGLLEGVGRFCSIMLTLNLVLFLFNLVPLPPMDGASVLAGLVPAARRLRDEARKFGIFGLLIAWMIFGKIFTPIYAAVLALLYGR